MIVVLFLTRWFYRGHYPHIPCRFFPRFFSSRHAVADDPDWSFMREFPRPIRRALTELVVTVGKRSCSPAEINRLIISAQHGILIILEAPPQALCRFCVLMEGP
jgi:hypothetical protein